MTQPTLFDLAAGEAAKQEGLYRASNPIFRQLALESARQHARHLAGIFDTVTIDAVKSRMLNFGENPEDLGNAAGNVFLTAEWEWVGSEKSAQKLRHAGRISKWRWRHERTT